MFAWGFTVDDALVAARVAHQWSLGRGYAFNPGGPSVDAVTPLGWAAILVPFAKDSPWEALEAARWLGVFAWLGAVLVTVRLVIGSGTGRSRCLALALLAIATPPAAWASSGMETGVVALLGALALRRSGSAPWAAGVAAAWRPELLPWAVTTGLGSAWAEARCRQTSPPSPWSLLAALPSGVAPAVLVAGVRYVWFGSPAPLSVFAKPSDVLYGLWYVAAGLLWAGPVWLLIAARPWRALEPRERALGVALLAHAVAMCMAGGDWMPLFRLWIPVWPSMVVLGAAICDRGSTRANAVRFMVGAVVSLAVALTTARQGRAVMETRRDWIAALAPRLESGDVVAALDVGWVGAAAKGPVIDFAGITDPEVAHLAGPHHAKRLDRGFLERRRVNVLVLLLESGNRSPGSPSERRYARSVEDRLRTQDGIEAFEAVAVVGSARAKERYAVLRRRNE